MTTQKVHIFVVKYELSLKILRKRKWRKCKRLDFMHRCLETNLQLIPDVKMRYCTADVKNQAELMDLIAQKMAFHQYAHLTRIFEELLFYFHAAKVLIWSQKHNFLSTEFPVMSGMKANNSDAQQSWRKSSPDQRCETGTGNRQKVDGSTSWRNYHCFASLWQLKTSLGEFSTGKLRLKCATVK